MAVGDVFAASLLAVGQVAVLMAGGAYLSYLGILNQDSCRSYSKVVFRLFYPALLLTSVGKAVTPDEIVNWWPLPVVCALVCGIGFALGAGFTRVMNFHLRPANQVFTRGFVGACTLRTSAYMPIILVQSLFGPLGSVSLQPKDYDGCSTTGPSGPQECAIAYIAFYVVFIVIVNWAGMFTYLAGDKYGISRAISASTVVNPAKRRHASSSPNSPSSASSHESINSAGSRSPSLDDHSIAIGNGSRHHKPHAASGLRHSRLGPNYQSTGSANDALLDKKNAVDRRKQLKVATDMAEQNMAGGDISPITPVKFVATAVVADTTKDISTVERILNPPMIACLVAIVIGLIGPVQRWLFGDTIVPRSIVNVLHLLGSCAAPSALMLTGASLGRGKPHSAAVYSTDIWASVIINMIITPLTVGALIYGADQGGLLHGQNNIFKFVLFIESATPTNSNLVIICQLLRGGAKKAKAMAVLCFWTYVWASFFLSFWIFGYLYYLFGSA